jgi:hypothetical protein
VAIGQDLEFFLRDPRNGDIVPAHEFFPIKEEAIKINLCSGHHTGGGEAQIYRDGLAVEVNTPGGHCRAYMWGAVTYAIEEGKSAAGCPELIASLNPIAEIDLALLKDYPEDLREFGCTPSFNAYTQEQTKIPYDAETAPYRTAGGHMHVSGFTNAMVKDKDYMCTYTKLCDLLIGLPAAVIFDHESEFQRRELYGKAGEFRLKDHREPTHTKPFWGQEYRVLSSRLWSHPAFASLFFGIYRDVIQSYQKDLIKAWNPILDEPLQRAINTGEGAVEMLEEWEKVLKPYDETIRTEQRRSQPAKKYIGVSSLMSLTPSAILKTKKETEGKTDEAAQHMEHGDGHHCGWNNNIRRWEGTEYVPPR